MHHLLYLYFFDSFQPLQGIRHTSVSSKSGRESKRKNLNHFFFLLLIFFLKRDVYPSQQRYHFPFSVFFFSKKEILIKNRTKKIDKGGTLLFFCVPFTSSSLCFSFLKLARERDRKKNASCQNCLHVLMARVVLFVVVVHCSSRPSDDSSAASSSAKR